MTDQPNENLTGHEYDGIREYDNPLPGWWTWLFVLSIFFSCLYVMYYHIGTGPTLEEKYQAEMAHHIERLLEQLGDIQADNETILRYMSNEEWMEATAGMFVGNCSQCHLADGGGNVGPNLTDEYYKNVNEPRDIFKVITEGVKGKGMQPWEDRLSEPQRILLAAYVASLRGKNVAGGKAAEGSKIPAWSAAPAPEPEAEQTTSGS